MLQRVREFASRLGLRLPRRLSTPSNWRRLSATIDEVSEQVEYGLLGGGHYENWLRTLGVDIRSAGVAELGPGVVFGAAAYLRAAGAEVTLIDRWLAGWTAGYHDAVYEAMIKRIEAEHPGHDCAPLRQLVVEGAYGPNTLRALQAPVEALDMIEDATFDAVVSNAVLEHIADPKRAFSEIFRITKPGGVGVHQVDYRDHRNFNAPLEHLLLSENEFDALNSKVNMEYGSQRRHSDYASLLTDAGFLIEAYHQNATASQTYLDDVITRMKVADATLWSQTRSDELANLGGLFLLRRP